MLNLVLGLAAAVLLVMLVFLLFGLVHVAVLMMRQQEF